MGKNIKKNAYITESLCYIAEYCKTTIFQLKKPAHGNRYSNNVRYSELDTESTVIYFSKLI